MDFTQVIEEIKHSKLAARRYEKSGHGKFRDLITVCRNGKFRFERYCYGEAASLVCTLWAPSANAEGTILWDFSQSSYSGKTEAPAQLTGADALNLLFDAKTVPWEPEKDLKSLSEAGLGGLKMLFTK